MHIYYVEIQHRWISHAPQWGNNIFPLCAEFVCFFVCKLQIYQAERKDTLWPGRMEELGGEMDPPLPREMETCGPEMDLLLPETWTKLNHSTITSDSIHSVLETG
jgi:hypothetical protein